MDQTHEEKTEPPVPRNTARIEAFSDGVFAFGFTLLILDLHTPERTNDLSNYLLSLWPQIFGFIVSALLIGLIWANHRAMLLHIRTVDRLSIFLTVLLLADVAFVPFPTAVLSKAIASDEGLPAAAFFYGATLTVGGVFFNAFWLYASHGIGGSGTPRPNHLRVSIRFGIGPAAYLAATLMSLWWPAIAIALYVGLILFFWFPGQAERGAEPE